jgi:hypothetical protein
MALLIDGVKHEVPGVTVIGPDETSFAHLSPGDGRPRKTRPQTVILHKTKGGQPERVSETTGPSGRAERVARFWQEDPKHSGAHLISGSDGVVACLEDLVRFEAWHATVANARSIGFEIYEEQAGVVHRAALRATVATCKTIAIALGIQLQTHRFPWDGKTLARFSDGGSTLIGFFGHHHVGNRGLWDPGVEVFEMLSRDLGIEAFDFAAGEDRDVWRDRQRELEKLGLYTGAPDGIPGPKTTKALRDAGYVGGLYALGKNYEVEVSP